MKLQEFQEHIHQEHPTIWEKMKRGDGGTISLQEYYAAAQRHRQLHLHPEAWKDHQHYNDMGKPVALGARDVTI